MTCLTSVDVKHPKSPPLRHVFRSAEVPSQFIGIFAWSGVGPMDQIEIKTNHHSYKLQREKQPTMTNHPWLYDRLHKMIQPQVFLPKWPGLLHLLLSGKNRSHGAHTCRRIQEDAPKGHFNGQLCFFGNFVEQNWWNLNPHFVERISKWFVRTKQPLVEDHASHPWLARGHTLFSPFLHSI